jgi:hypothetical protein
MLGVAVFVKIRESQENEDEKLAVRGLVGPPSVGQKRFRARLSSRSALQIRR